MGGVTLVVIGLALVAKVISVFWVLAPLFAIVVLAVIHERVTQKARAMFPHRGLLRARAGAN